MNDMPNVAELLVKEVRDHEQTKAELKVAKAQITNLEQIREELLESIAELESKLEKMNRQR